MKKALLIASFSILAATTATAETAMTVFKDPNCGCCTAWADHMQDAGFDITIRELEYDAMRAHKASVGVPEDAVACHTAMIGDFVIEGHVPAEDIRHVLANYPDASGVAVPGMPMGSPGMGQMAPDTVFDVVLLRDGDIGQVVTSYPTDGN